MAVRENQTLQIAVMIFFLLVVLLSVTTYVFFKNSDDKAKALTAEKTAKATAEKNLRAATDKINKLMALMGYNMDNEDTVDAKMASIEADYAQDMGVYSVGFGQAGNAAAGLAPVAGDAEGEGEGEGEGDAAPALLPEQIPVPEGERNYRSLLAHWYSQSKQKHGDLIAERTRHQEALDKIQVLEGTKDKQIVEFKETADKIGQDAAAERSKFNQERTRVTQSADSVAKQLDAKRAEQSQVVAKYTGELKKMTEQRNKVTQQNEVLRERNEKSKEQGFEIADGLVTRVNQKSRVVWINLGQGDNLKRQTIFSVYPAGQVQALPEKKASIEVMRIIDDHMAEARILEDDLSNPILPGDQVFSPVWQRGHSDGFALAGFMDIDGDGRSDRLRIRDLILYNGGQIDAELLDSGKLEGKLKINTKYIIIGDPPTSKTTNAELLENHSYLIDEARQLGVETIAVDKFVNQLGYVPEQRTVRLGEGAKSSDFKASPPEGVQRRSTGSTYGGFKKRERPASTF